MPEDDTAIFNSASVALTAFSYEVLRPQFETSSYPSDKCISVDVRSRGVMPMIFTPFFTFRSGSRSIFFAKLRNASDWPFE